MLSKRERIPRSQFASILKEGRYVKSPSFLLRIAPSGSKRAQIAVSVSKKVSKSAVGRNALRRRTYAAIRPFIDRLTPHRFFFMAQPEAKTLKGERLSEEIEALFRKADALK